ncbi:SOS response-associated peptidase family protein [Sphingomonas faeni]|uniref:SOS response-associated peptidase family protein n=1 Tax=Sphingomonas faeni TaxID=185950 RepID=UPI00277FD20E|nr:SOS response-associated peptidase family protein [Sphingomonas faeni]MDQ0839945.1 putative SOS response-associated peptidase YedK [Sphingomonas faeni]
MLAPISPVKVVKGFSTIRDYPMFYGQVVVQDGADRKIERMEWGVPTQVPRKLDPAVKLTKYVTNVRNLSSSFWRSMLTTPARRCLVPVTAFSEFGIAPGEDGKKPLHWFDVPSCPIFAFAGIRRPTERGNAYGFLTTEPNAIVAPIHPKAMPVVLHDDDYDRWLSAPWDDLKDVVAPYPSQLMRGRTLQVESQHIVIQRPRSRPRYDDGPKGKVCCRCTALPTHQSQFL